MSNRLCGVCVLLNDILYNSISPNQRNLSILQSKCLWVRKSSGTASVSSQAVNPPLVNSKYSHSIIRLDEANPSLGVTSAGAEDPEKLHVMGRS